MRFLLLLIMGLMLAFPAGQTDAQGVGALLSQTGNDATAAEENIDRIMKQAAQNGVGVVVIDSAGNLLSTANPEATDTGLQEEDGMSPLMAAQDRAVRFRAALVERLMLLPSAFNEVVYILRAASPDGTLWAFGRALLISLALFGVGVVVEREIWQTDRAGVRDRAGTGKPPGLCRKNALSCHALCLWRDGYFGVDAGGLCVGVCYFWHA